MQTNQSGSGMKVSGLTPDLQSMGMGVVPGFSSPSGANPFAFASPFKGIGMENSLVGFSPGQNYLPNMFYSSPQSLVHPSAQQRANSSSSSSSGAGIASSSSGNKFGLPPVPNKQQQQQQQQGLPLGSAGATVAGTTTSASKIPLTSTHSARTGEGSLALLSRGEAGTPQSEVGDSSFFGDLSPSVFASPKLGEVDLYSVHAPDTGLQPAAAIVAAVASTTASDDAAARLAMSEDDIARSPLRVGRDSSALQMLATASAEKRRKVGLRLDGEDDTCSLGIAGRDVRRERAPVQHDLEANEDLNDLSAIHDQSVVDVDVSGHDIDMDGEDDHTTALRDSYSNHNDSTVLNVTHNRSMSMSASMNTTTNILERSHSQSSANTSISFTQGSNTSSLPTPGKRKLVSISATAVDESFDGFTSNNTTQLDISSDRDAEISSVMDGNTTLDLSQPIASIAVQSERDAVPVSAKRHRSSTRTKSDGSKTSDIGGEMFAKDLSHSGTRTRSRRQSVR